MGCGRGELPPALIGASLNHSPRDPARRSYVPTLPPLDLLCLVSNDLRTSPCQQGKHNTKVKPATRYPREGAYPEQVSPHSVVAELWRFSLEHIKYVDYVHTSWLLSTQGTAATYCDCSNYGIRASSTHNPEVAGSNPAPACSCNPGPFRYNDT